MDYAIGSLVNVRNRDWIVLPSDDPNWYLLKPLGGSDHEITMVSPKFETVEPARFAKPNPKQCGDAASAKLLLDAVRLGFRSTTGPFRSFARIAVEPRPYQLVPLLMALRQKVIRLLIADDVGVGKTIEAGLIVREMLDRGEVSRFTVLCPPPLAEQWQRELADKFNLDAVLVLTSTVKRLERNLSAAESIFERYPYTIVSLDYIKSEQHRMDFLRACPNLVIVDEAHSCAAAGGNQTSKQRFTLVDELARDPNRQMLFLTATPHSGKEDVFRSLLTFLNPEFAALPSDLSGAEHEADRRLLAQYFVQRRRGDVYAYLDKSTFFPKRVSGELTWKFSQEERRFFNQAVALAQDSLKLGAGQSDYRKRIYQWSALSLLRAISSSPSAAKNTLKNRSSGIEGEPLDLQQLDLIGRQTVFDQTYTDDLPVSDNLPGANTSLGSDLDDELKANLKLRYEALAALAEKLELAHNDSKLNGLIDIVRKLLKDGYSPIIFCRFIHTADYVVRGLRAADGFSQVDIRAVTSMLPPEMREDVVYSLCQSKERVLVTTDCLSEGVNLQDHFDAVVHYDLSWNPTRHEQREGRVDRFGQPSKEVRVLTYYGIDNPIDGYVLEVLLRKHNAIRNDLGISVPFPEDTQSVLQAIMEGFLLKAKPEADGRKQGYLPGLEDLSTEKKRLDQEWEKLAAREEKRSRTMFAQQAIKVADVAKVLAQESWAIGDTATLENFISKALTSLGAFEEIRKSSDSDHHVHHYKLDEQFFKDNPGLNLPNTFATTFSLPAKPSEIVLTRTHPIVENLASYIFEGAMDPGLSDINIASRCGVMRTKAVTTRTTLLLCRFRFLLTTTSNKVNHQVLLEECASLPFTGLPAKANWLDEKYSQELFAAKPSQNIDQTTKIVFLEKVLDNFDQLTDHINLVCSEHSERILEEHRQVRTAANIKGISYKISVQDEPDILGVFIYLPEIQ